MLSEKSWRGKQVLMLGHVSDFGEIRSELQEASVLMPIAALIITMNLISSVHLKIMTDVF